MSHMSALYGSCPFATAQEVITGKWKLLIIKYIADGHIRFGQLRKKLPGCTQTMLTNQLRSLEKDGIIARTVFAKVPPHVEYSLTPIGKQLPSIIALIGQWGVSYINCCSVQVNEKLYHSRMQDNDDSTTRNIRRQMNE